MTQVETVLETRVGAPRGPTTAAERELWTASQLAPEASLAFNEARVLRLEGDLDSAALASALEALTRRHPALRAAFSGDGTRVRAAPPGPLPLPRLSPASVGDVASIVDRELTRPFDLGAGALFRASLVATAPAEHHLVLSAHQLACDGPSWAVLLRDLAGLYGACRGGATAERAAETEPLPPAPVGARPGPRDQDERYWTERLAAPPADLELPCDEIRPRMKTFAAGHVVHRLDPALVARVAEWTATADVPLRAPLLAALEALLFRLTGQTDLVVAVPFRLASEDPTERIGQRLHAVPVRVHVEPRAGFERLARDTAAALSEAERHAGLSFDEILRHVQVARDPSRLPLACVCFELERAPAAPEIALPGLRTCASAAPRRHELYDLHIRAVEEDGAVSLHVHFGADLFDAESVRTWMRSLEALLDAGLRTPEAALERLPCVSRQDQERLDAWNATERPVPEVSLAALVEEQVARTPDAVAVRCRGGDVTYRDLDRRANRLARRLRADGVGPGVLVGLALRRSAEMVVALVAVEKAGGAYVPLDPAYPRDRLSYMLEHSRAPVLVTERTLRETLPSVEHVVCVDAEADAAAVARESDAPLGAIPGASPEDPAYVIFTSGSTGKPKGVVVPVRAVVNVLASLRERPGMSASDTVLAICSLSFDVSVFDFWLPLTVGARILLEGTDVAADGARVLSLLRDGGVTVLQATPATFRLMVAAGWQRGPPLKIVSMGEALPRDVADELTTRSDDVWDMYGPTETTVWSTWWKVPAAAKQILVGKPIANTQVHVLDRFLQPLPPGAVGELYIGGVGVALGYLRRPELTAERFLPDPFRPGGVLYKTGDQARWRPSGELEYLGRNDHQIKVRGFRIELGEIEAVLATHPAVAAAVAVAREDAPGDVRLVAYAVARPGAALDDAALREHVARALPQYMVPQHFVQLDAFPLSPNGKIDRKALPAPGTARPELPHEFVAPLTELERRVAALWTELLRVEQVGRLDRFFDLGGTSTLAVRMVARVREELRLDVPVVTIFASPQLMTFCAAIAPDAPVPARAAVPLRASRPAGDGAIAVIGMAGRFPGANDVEEFWRNLLAGADTVARFSDAELDPSIPDRVRRHRAYVPARGIIDGAELFDAAFFGMNRREAEILDPQNRLLLEVTWEVLERSGHVPESFPGTIGVFAGKYDSTYHERCVATQPELVEAFGEFNVRWLNEKDYVATRIAYALDLTGPALSLHTACSTSLVAVCEAVASLRRGECDLALAGGGSVTVPIRSGHVHQEGSVLTSDGHTRPFDARASGTTFSDGVAMVALRRLDDAVRDGDVVYAVIRGAAVNNDGARRASFAAPSVDGQAEVIVRAQRDAGVDPRSISYVEAHGTATPLGDPIEVEALTRAFRRGTQDTGFCGLGSVKSNVGHLVAAAGAAGLIKTALALHHEVIPGTAHFDRPNPRIDFASSPFRVTANAVPWKRGAVRRLAGVSSFGVGGTNAHVVLEEAPVADPGGPGRPRELLVLSARTPTALDALARRLAEHLRAHPELQLADVAHTLQTGRARFSHRRFATAAVTAEAADLLADPTRLPTRKVDAPPPPVVFAFPGQGAQYVGMGENLYRAEPVFRETMDRACDAVRPMLDRDLRDVLYPASGDGADATRTLTSTAYAQPALFALELALARLWVSWGVVPEAMVGHSVGEFVCATIAGVLSPDDAARLVATRGTLMQALPPGAMLAVNASVDELARHLKDRRVAVAADNAPGSCVAAGPAEAIARLQQQLEADGVACRPVHTSHAFHSPMMDPAVPAFAGHLRQVALAAPAVPFVSTVTGTWITEAQARDPVYWARHLRETVRFRTAVQTLWEDPRRLLLEVGPRTTLTALARRQAADPTRQLTVASLGDTARNDAEWSALLAALGHLWTASVPVDWRAFRARERRGRVVLPTYPFERKRFWTEPTASRAAPAAPTVPAAAARPPPAATASPVIAAPEPPPPSPAMPMPSSRKAHLATLVREVFEELSGTELDGAVRGATFVELGMDSLFFTQAALELGRKFGVDVTFRDLMERLDTVEAVAAHLDAILPAGAFTPADATAVSSLTSAAAPTAGAATLSAPALASRTSLAAVSEPPATVPPAASTASNTVPAAAAPAPIAFGLPAGSLPGNGQLQAIIADQLRIIAQQLALLGAAPQPQAPALLAAAPQLEPSPQPEAAAHGAAPAERPAAVDPPARRPPEPADAVAQEQYDPKKAFGAIARIHLAGDDLSARQRARLEAFVRRYVERTKTSKRLTQEHRATLADPRVVTGFKPAIKEIVYQVVVERSDGPRLWDVDGNEYVDCLNGFGASYFGWQPSFVTEAVKRQLHLGHEIGPMTPLAYEVANLVCELTGMERAAFCNTGSEAVLGCMRIARTVTGRALVASFTGSYHGVFDEVIVRGTRKLKAVPAAPGIVPSAVTNMLVLDYGTPESLEIIRQRAGELAAVLIEPVQSRRPDFQPREFLHAVREITARSRTACIFDEVICGFRVHPAGAQGYFGIQADLASYGKVVGAGYPLGVIAGRRPWMDALDGGPWQFGDDSAPTAGVTYFAGTFCRHPLALAAAKAALQHLKDRGLELQRRVNERTAQLARELNATFKAVGAPLEVRHFSALWKVFFTEERPYQELLFPMLRARGLHILEGFPCFLTTVHGDAEVTTIVKAFKEAVAEMQEAEFFPAPPRVPVGFPAAPAIAAARVGRDGDGRLA
jgi:amino acid adenylation domain-containing protein